LSAFLDALRSNSPRPDDDDRASRRWLFVAYDQLTDRCGPLATEAPEELGIVLIETLWKPRRRTYHKQKLALVLASQRHFALEQARRGVAVLYVVGDGSYAEELDPITREIGPLRMLEAAEYELRDDLRPLVEAGRIEVLPNETWMTTSAQFQRAFAGGKRWRMDAFYRQVRRDSDILMEDGKPVGGRFSFDAENRRRWRGEPLAPVPPDFPLDAIKREVVELVEARFPRHPGRLDPDQLPATQGDAEALWAWAREQCMPHFGPYEDAMSVESRSLFHTRISALLNNGRLLPARVVRDVEALDIPLASKEGFIRQVLGWREFIHHVHAETDGFRTLESQGSPNALGAKERLPPAFWGETSGLRCLDRVVEEVWETGYGHHITRLMILSNLATLLAIDPREVADWFWVAYVDAYDWVVEPNVLGMGTFALGDLFVTKPYVSGAAYIHKMSDYCETCAFSPRKDCPITGLYWDFLERHKGALKENPRVAMPLRSLAKRAPDQKRQDRDTRIRVQQTLADGRVLRPGDRS
jgi:deoxyribodipyrimidine photolyase-related protein